MYDLIVTKQKKYKTKLLIILLGICFLLVIFFIIVINKINIANNKDIKDIPVVKMTEINIDEIVAKQKKLEIRDKNKNVLTQEQIEKIDNIYTSSEEKRVFLTFDDGPSKTVTPLILDLLKQENIKATFFVLGNRVEQNPDIINRIFEEGHYIANHGYSHKYSSIYTSIETVLDEYNKAEQCIKVALNNNNYNSRVFRFPGRFYWWKISSN